MRSTTVAVHLGGPRDTANAWAVHITEEGSTARLVIESREGRVAEAKIIIEGNLPEIERQAVALINALAEEHNRVVVERERRAIRAAEIALGREVSA
jgi:hypothetical protein